MTDAEKRGLLYFMKRRCSCSERNMYSWLLIPEFVDAVHVTMIDRDVRIDDVVVLQIMERIMPDILSGKVACPQKKNAVAGLNQLRRAVEEKSKLPVT